MSVPLRLSTAPGSSDPISSCLQIFTLVTGAAVVVVTVVAAVVLVVVAVVFFVVSADVVADVDFVVFSVCVVAFVVVVVVVVVFFVVSADVVVSVVVPLPLFIIFRSYFLSSSPP